jgi:hypothetical protein
MFKIPAAYENFPEFSTIFFHFRWSSVRDMHTKISSDREFVKSGV